MGCSDGKVEEQLLRADVNAKGEVGFAWLDEAVLDAE